MSSGGMSSALGKLDPLGNKITQWGGDPLNLYGNQNNPNAALFPSGTPAAAAPLVLPAPSGGITPITYNPNSFVQRQPAGPGNYNAMAAQLAGPAYVPQILSPPPMTPSPGIGGTVRMAPTNLAPTNTAPGGAAPVSMGPASVAPTSVMPGDVALAQLLAQVRGDVAPPVAYNPKLGATVYAK